MANTTKKKSTTKSTAKKSPAKKSTTTKKASTAKKSTAKKTTPKKTKKTTIVQNENSYGRTIFVAILLIVLCIGGYAVVQHKKSSGENSTYVATADEKQFKTEYESLNNTEGSNGTISAVSIIEDNNIEYITIEEAAEILDNGSGVIYFGFAECPWCRLSVPVLLSAMEQSGLDKIYYVNLRPDGKTENDVRDIYTLDSRNKAKKTKDASDAYYEVLRSLANELQDYVLTTENNKKVNTGEKRLYAPTVVSVIDGVLVGFHEGTVEGHDLNEDGALPALTKEEETELLNAYTKVIGNYLGEICDEDAGC